MLQDPGSGNGTVLRHVADQEYRRSDLLGEPHEAGGGFPDLGHAAGVALEAGVGDGLDGVDDRQARGLASNCLADGVQVVLGQQENARLEGAEALGPHADLVTRFLACDVEHLARAGHLRRGVHEEGRFADAGLAADQDQAPRDDAATQHAVELAPGEAGPGRLLGVDLDQRGGAGGLQRSGFRQWGHWPAQRRLSPPHSVQTKVMFDLGIARLCTNDRGFDKAAP